MKTTIQVVIFYSQKDQMWQAVATDTVALSEPAQHMESATYLELTQQLAADNW